MNDGHYTKHFSYCYHNINQSLLILKSPTVAGDDWLGIFCAHQFSTAATIEIISSLICEENIVQKTTSSAGLLKVLYFHCGGTCVNFFSKMFYIQENVAGSKFWWVETTITRRDKVFWEKESQMRGRRCFFLVPFLFSF